MDLIRYFFRTKPDLIEPMNGSVLMLLSLVSFAFVIYYIKKDYPINRTKKCQYDLLILKKIFIL